MAIVYSEYAICYLLRKQSFNQWIACCKLPISKKKLPVTIIIGGEIFWLNKEPIESWSLDK